LTLKAIQEQHSYPFITGNKANTNMNTPTIPPSVTVYVYVHFYYYIKHRR